MPDNKKAIIRYRFLDKCFSNKFHKYYIDELVEKCNEELLKAGVRSVSKRQIYDDIEFMKSKEGWSAPIVSIQDGRRKYIKYSEDFSIANFKVSEMELEQLHTLIASLVRFQGLPVYYWVEELLTNLRLRFGAHNDMHEVIGFEQNRDMCGLKYLSDAINYIIKKQPIKIVYQPFGKPQCTWVLHPYYVKQYNNRWFLLGYNGEFEDISIIPLDRILSISTINIEYRRNLDYDFERYFKDIIGVSFDKNAQRKHIVLKFSPLRFPYVKSKPLHHSQTIDETENTVTIDVIPNKELVAQLLSFGNDVEVVYPASLKDEMKRKIQEMYEKYFVVK